MSLAERRARLFILAILAQPAGSLLTPPTSLWNVICAIIHPIGMKRVYFIIFFLLIFAISSQAAQAHPGRTAADGCHYCRTNCDQWGVPWNERHCHGGSSTSGGSAGSTGSSGASGDSTSANVLPATDTQTVTTFPTRLPTRIPTPTKTPYIETGYDKKKLFKVVEVVDGDTIKVNLRGVIESVRLLAIDTPETKDPRKPVQCFGREATNKMKAFVSGQYVKLVDDRLQGNRDKYQRLLRYVYLQNGTFVNRQMVEQGYAFSYKEYPTKYLEDFNKLEKFAREKELGLWKSCR
ncbi:MAG: thermonuclease family protein [bacterium]|nr:thermonuclease family protein [bacterium]